MISDANKKFIVYAGALLIALLFITLYYNTSLIRTQEDTDALKETAGMLIPPLPENIFGLAGKIVAKGIASLTLEINSLTNRTPVNGVMPKERRTVRIDGSTSVKELTFSRAKLGSPPVEKTITLNNLQVGDQIIVTASENIKEKNSFTAALIQKHVFE